MVIELDDALNELVIANRILANENVVDAYGHVSVRHPRNPERFFMAHMLATPEIVERSDIVEFGLDGEAVSDGRTPSVERFIHSGIYEARPDVVAVVWAHPRGAPPFFMTDVASLPVIPPRRFFGTAVAGRVDAAPFWGRDLFVS